MSLKLLLDENISPVVAQRLAEMGFDAVHVREVGLKGAKDPDILVYASRTGRFLVTLDADFADVRRYPVGTHRGILRLRLKFAPPDVVLELLRTLLPKLAQVKPGALIVSDAHRYRIRER